MATIAKSVPEQADPAARFERPWMKIAWFGALLIVSYAPVLYYLAYQWYNDEDMGHGFFVPVIAAYIAWSRRDKLASIPLRTSYWGLALVIFGAVQFTVGTLGANIFLARTAFLISLTGTIWFLCGTRMLRALAFPLALLWFMIPIPAIIYARITLPLQLFASKVAENVLWRAFNIPVLRDGNVLELANQKLSVVEACSGIRSLLALSFLSLVYAYFFDPKTWMRWVLLIATIPIAIAANASRVTITGLLYEYRPDLAQGFFHLLEGWVLFLVALFLLIGFHQLVNRIYNRWHAATPVRPEAASA
jgi:exosortase